MKIALLFIILSLLQQPLFGQEDSMKLLDRGDSLADLIPADWQLLSSAKGDLNT